MVIISRKNDVSGKRRREERRVVADRQRGFQKC
jgi:hypothetical protein